MKRCIALAINGLGSTAPNPMVGCVIVHKDRIFGEGFTSPYGGAHAEVNAINSVADKTILKQSTLYVTLEPCSHFGKTPPCSDLILSHGIPKIVIGCVDPNSKVSGRGIERLKANGCEVIVGVEETACKTHHKRFLTFQTKKRPYIILKWAKTKDGFVAPKTKKNQTTGVDQWTEGQTTCPPVAIRRTSHIGWRKYSFGRQPKLNHKTC
jgi:diaminohydroxyphosphoribosylaminopyrimidine deaminase/5-amino-6-(5-phosphoribosylamino)uracil reductase